MPIARVAEVPKDVLAEGLAMVRAAPRDEGKLVSIARRPAKTERELLDEAEITLASGVEGDVWRSRPGIGSKRPNPNAQVTVMSSRAAALVADGDDPWAWAQAGDQLYVDLDLSEANLPPGTRLEIGDAVLEVTEDPHLGCGKFVKRFGTDAMKFVNSEEGRALRLRGVNTRVVVPGKVARGDAVRKIEDSSGA